MPTRKASSYSPSQTLEFVRCPMKRHLKYVENWSPRVVGRKELAAIGGQAFAVGMAAYNKGKLNKIGVDPSPGEYAFASAQDSFVRLNQAGQVIDNAAVPLAAGLSSAVRRAVDRAIAEDPTPPSWNVVGVELSFPNYGNARLDVIHEDGPDLVVTDYKLKLRLEKRYVEKELQKYKHSWAMFHYVQAASDYFKRPVYRYNINLIILEPTFSHSVHVFTVSPEALEWWRASAEWHWNAMAELDAFHGTGPITYIPMSPYHTDDYGVCEYYKACFDCRLEPILMDKFYVRNKR